MDVCCWGLRARDGRVRGCVCVSETDVQLSHLSEKRAGNLTHFQFIENYAEVYRALELRNQTDFLVDETQRDKKPTVLFRNVALR